MDNKIFNVNGRSKDQLEQTLKLALLDEYGKVQTVKGYVFYPEKGFVLLWHVDPNKPNEKAFPVPLSYDMVANVVWDWLKTDEAESVPLGDWEDDCDHDGDNDKGFRVYTESWGHVHEKGEYTINHYSIVAIKSVYCWYGK
jgi:hypothetical protein